MEKIHNRRKGKPWTIHVLYMCGCTCDNIRRMQRIAVIHQFPDSPSICSRSSSHSEIIVHYNHSHAMTSVSHIFTTHHLKVRA